MFNFFLDDLMSTSNEMYNILQKVFTEFSYRSPDFNSS
jgi:hypothetical protein